MGRLKELQRQQPIYETLLMKIGAAQKQIGRLSSLVRLTLPDAPPKTAKPRRVTFQFALDREKLRTVRRREGRYLLRSNLTASDPAQLWQSYLQLVEVEAAFLSESQIRDSRPYTGTGHLIGTNDDAYESATWIAISVLAR